MALTTGQVAKICGVSPRTASKWCDDGRLKHYRIPGSQDRRITREAMIEFLRDNNLPFSLPVSGVLLVGYARRPGWWLESTCAADTFSAGILLKSWVPAVIAVDCWVLGCQSAASFARAVRSDGRWRKSRLVAILPDDTDTDEAALQAAGYGDVVRGEDGLRAARAWLTQMEGGV